MALYHCAGGKDAQRSLGLVAGSGTGLALLASLQLEFSRFLRTPAAKANSRFLVFLVFFKYPLLGLVLYPLFAFKWVDPAAFVGGFVLVQAALILSALRQTARTAGR